MSFVVRLFAIAAAGWVLLFPGFLSAQSIEALEAGVVKITAESGGKRKVGTGFVVQSDKDRAYIVTASHVVAGDKNPEVEFSTQRNIPVSTKVVGLEGEDPNGLALLLVTKQIPPGLPDLGLNSSVSVNKGDRVITIGFPRISGVPWAMIKGDVVGKKGKLITFSGPVDEGNSGGPLIKGEQVIGVVTQVKERFAYAVPAGIAQYSLEGWGVKVKERRAVPPTKPPEPTPERPPKTFTNAIGMKFVLIQPGTFMMGSGITAQEVAEKYGGEAEWYEREHPQHKVKIGKPFYMQTTEVTQGQWKEVMKKNPSDFKECGDDCPVENVSWNDVQEFLKKLNQMEGTDKYRLPTEAEWEYACRAGTTTPFHTGNCISTDQANYHGNYPGSGCPKGEYRKRTVRVGSFQPNAWGLYDMHGNVWEWCQDWYGDYPSGDVEDPKGPPSGEYRVLRGGSWIIYARDMRSAYRGWSFPDFRINDLGFRVARDF